MLLPSPDSYDTWQDYARALNAMLMDLGISADGQQETNYYNISNLEPAWLPGTPAGFNRVWLSEADAKLYLENPAYDPPVAGDIVFIDTAAIADAAIVTSKIAPLSVIEGLIANAAVGTTKIQNLAVTNALIAHGAVGTLQVADLAVIGAKIALAAIVTAHIGDLQVTTAKIDDLAVNDAKIANLAVTSAKIANLSVGAAHIIAASIQNAHIEGIIQSNSWNPTTKAGWQLDKAGVFRGQGIEIYDNTGALIFGSGGTITLSRVIDAGNLAALDSITSSGLIDDGVLTAAKLVAGIFTALNISTYIEAAAIGAALIGNLAVGNAHIADLAVSNAKIADATIQSAKIVDLVVSKLTSGTLDAVIDVGEGILKFTIGASALYIGRGFGVTDQFFLWYGPNTIAPADANELAATIYFKVDGSAYFGGNVTGSGTGGLREDFYAPFELSSAIAVDTAAITVTGADRTYIVNYNWTSELFRVNPGAQGGTTSATFLLERWNGATWDFLDDTSIVGSFSTPDANTLKENMGGSLVFTDTTGGVSVRLRARLSARSIRTFAGSPPDVGDTDTQDQTLSITVLEA